MKENHVGNIRTQIYPCLEMLSIHRVALLGWFFPLFFSKIVLKLQAVDPWKQGLLERNGSFLQGSQGTSRKKKLKSIQALHLATQHLKFSFLILREGKDLLLFPPFYVLQFNPEKPKILGCFDLCPLWSVCVFPFLTVHLFNTSSGLEAWQCGKRNNKSNTETEREISWKLFVPVFYNILKRKRDKTGIKYHLQRPVTWNSEVLKFLVSVKIREKREKKIKPQIP